MKPLNTVISNCPPSGIRRFFDIAQQMEDVISLGIGEPDYVSPPSVIQAGIRALERGVTNYTSNSGLLSLRERICQDVARCDGAWSGGFLRQLDASLWRLDKPLSGG